MDYQASGSEQEEDETTIAEQEEVEGTTDVQAELDALQQEGLFWLFMAGCMWPVNAHQWAGGVDYHPLGMYLEGFITKALLCTVLALCVHLVW